MCVRDTAEPHNTVGHRVFVPEFTQALRLELQGCATNASLGCPVHLTVGSATLPSNFQKVLTCSSPTQNCRLLLPSPPWNRWLQVTAQSTAGPHVVVAFSIVAALRGGQRGGRVAGSCPLYLQPPSSCLRASGSMQALEPEHPAPCAALQHEPEL